MAYKEEEIEAKFNKIIVEMISGRSLRSILKDEGMPVMSTFLKWVDEDESKTNHYARAINMRADYLFEEIVDIADDSSGDITVNGRGEEIMDSEFVQRSRLRVDARKWVVSKMNPKKYGDKQEIDHKNNGASFVPIININAPKETDGN